MNIVIYNINSFGGNYEYAKCLCKAYENNSNVDQCLMLMPANAKFEKKYILKILCADIISSSNKLVKKIYFLYRSIKNPFVLFFSLLKRRSSVVLFNDFDQVTAFLWIPFFHLVKKKHLFAVMLHDPDRDNFFSSRKLSQMTMKSVMSIMDVAFFHGYLPDKVYYTGKFLKVKVPHGIYNDSVVNRDFLEKLKSLSKGKFLLGVLGNIRDEKNYEVIIDAVAELDNVMLLIAGKPANSQVSTDTYKKYAAKKNASEKIIWVEEYLDQRSFNAAIEACKIILLHYKPSFTSQSGVLNSIAPFKKKLIISDVESSLKETVIEYKLGSVIPHDEPRCLADQITRQLSDQDGRCIKNWERYIHESSWENHVEIAVKSYKQILNDH